MIVSSTSMYHDHVSILRRVAGWLNRSTPSLDELSPRGAKLLGGQGIVSNARSFRHGQPDVEVMSRLDRFLEPFNQAFLDLVASLPFEANVTALSLELDRNLSHPFIRKGHAPSG